MLIGQLLSFIRLTPSCHPYKDLKEGDPFSFSRIYSSNLVTVRFLSCQWMEQGDVIRKPYGFPLRRSPMGPHIHPILFSASLSQTELRSFLSYSAEDTRCQRELTQREATQKGEIIPFLSLEKRWPSETENGLSGLRFS
jgi:hypothetical protein